MASLTGQLVAETYKALLKVIDNDVLTASEKQITDGFGGGSNVFIDSNGFLRANKYKITNGLATQFLKADGSLDANTYLTSITSAQVTTALGYTPVTDQRTLTINGVTYNLTANRSWTVEGTAAVWGNITGTLSNQTDLQAALNAKYNVPAGTISQYIRGDGTLAAFPTLPGGLPTGGTAGQILAKIDATDYNTQWIDNYATQTKNEVKLGQTLTKGTPVYVSSANGTNMIVSAASNTSEALSSKTFGLLESGGATNDIVKCVTFGLLAGLDTSTASAGDPVWLGPNGTLIYGLVNKPYAPAHLVYIGVVTRVQSNNGEIFVNVQNGFELKEIHDVYIADPANNHGLFYDISDGLWKNKSIATALGYTPQAQLSGTGFVKASGTTITYDNSTYLTTTDAASTYQLLTNLSTDLTASETKYPSVNAVIAGLGTKLNLTGGTLTGNLTISSANPKLLLTDSDNNPDYSIQNYDGTFKISDETNSADRFLIYSTGIGYYNGDFKANKLYVEGGLSTQFIKGDGTLDSNTYLTSASLDGYLAKSGGTMTGDLNFYTLKTTRVGGNAYIRGSWQGTYWGIGAAATGHTIIIDQVDFSTGAYESITDVNLMLGTRTVVHSGNVATYALPISGGTVTGSITATSFVKSGGTSSEFLMADGSVSTLSSPVTGSGSAGYIPKWTTAANIGSSNIYDDGTSIGIAYSTPNKGGYGRTLTGAAFGSASFGFEAVGGTTTNGGLVGGLSFILSQNDASRIVGSAIQSNLVGTTATNYGADLRFFAKADAGVIGEVARMTSAGLRVYGTIIKDGGTASQFLKADGSIDSNTYLTSSSAIAWANISGKPTTLSGYGITDAVKAYYEYDAPMSTIGDWIAMSQSTGISGWTHVLNMAWQGSQGNWVSQIAFAAQTGTGAYYRTTSGEITSASWIRFLDASNYGSYALPLSGGTVTGIITNTTTYIGYRAQADGTSAIWRGIIGSYNATADIATFIGNYAGRSGIFGHSNSMGAWNTLRINTLGIYGMGKVILSNNTVVNADSSDTEYALIHAGNVSTYAVVNRVQSNWNDSTVINNVVGLLAWKNYGNSHVIFDASAGTSPSGTGVSQTNATYEWTTTYPTLMGWNGSNTYGVRVDSARVSDNSGYSLQLNGYANQTEYIILNGPANGPVWKVRYDSATANRYYDLGFKDGNNVYYEGLKVWNGGSPTWAGNPLLTSANYSSYALPLSGGTMTGTLNFANGDGGLQSATSGGISFYQNEINAGAQGGTGTIYLGWRRTSQITVGSVISSNSVIYTSDIGSFGPDSGSNNGIKINYASSGYGRVRFHQDGNNHSTIHSFGSSWIGGVSQGYINIDGQSGVNIGGWNDPDFGVAKGSTTTVYRALNVNGGGTHSGTTYFVGNGNTGSAAGIGLNVYSSNGSGAIMAFHRGGYYAVNMGLDSDNVFRIGGWSASANRLQLDMSGNLTVAASVNAPSGYVSSPNPWSTANSAFFPNGITTAGTTNWIYGSITYIGNAPSNGAGHQFSSNGTATSTGAYTASSFFESSDMRLKTLIESNPIIEGIEKLEAKLYEKNGKIELGYFAQDAELLIPYAVTKNDEGFLNLSYREVHTAKIARLEQRVAELEKQLNLN